MLVLKTNRKVQMYMTILNHTMRLALNDIESVDISEIVL